MAAEVAGRGRAGVTVVAWGFGAVVFAGLVLGQVSGDATILGRYTGYVMPWLLVGLVPAAGWALRARRGVLATVLGASAAWIVALHAGRFVPRGAPAPVAGPTLRVMSWNTWSKNEDAARIAGVVRRAAPDVLLLQEIPPNVFARVASELRDLYGHDRLHVAYEPRLLQGLFSRFPIEARGSAARKGQAQEVVLRAPFGPVTVFNVHPLRSGGWRVRYAQIAALVREDVAPERSPVILGGDLNANEHTDLHRLLSGPLVDAHDAAGTGFDFTWPSSAVRLLGVVPARPVIRIDHLFFSRHFVALGAATLGDAGGSDHHPVVAEVGLSRPDAPRPARLPGVGAARL